MATQTPADYDFFITMDRRREEVVAVEAVKRVINLKFVFGTGGGVVRSF